MLKKSINFKRSTKGPVQTKKAGEILAKEILKNPGGKTALVIGLQGDLGGGKTTFLQGLARGLGIKQEILSPTFIIMKKFQIKSEKWKVENRKKTKRHPLLSVLYSLPSTLYHIDCYRIEKPKELLDLGFKEIISNPKNIVVAEWADKIRKIMPESAIWINFEFINERTRKITLRNVLP